MAALAHDQGDHYGDRLAPLLAPYEPSHLATASAGPLWPGRREGHWTNAIAVLRGACTRAPALKAHLAHIPPGLLDRPVGPYQEAAMALGMLLGSTNLTGCATPNGWRTKYPLLSDGTVGAQQRSDIAAQLDLGGVQQHANCQVIAVWASMSATRCDDRTTVRSDSELAAARRTRNLFAGPTGRDWPPARPGDSRRGCLPRARASADLGRALRPMNSPGLSRGRPRSQRRTGGRGSPTPRLRAPAHAERSSPALSRR